MSSHRQRESSLSESSWRVDVQGELSLCELIESENTRRALSMRGIGQVSMSSHRERALLVHSHNRASVLPNEGTSRALSMSAHREWMHKMRNFSGRYRASLYERS